jgi:hypothetical protein
MAPPNIDLTSPEPSSRSTRSTSIATTSQSSIPNTFGRMMQNEKGRDPILRDTCSRPAPKYNTNYNPYAIPREDLPNGYSPYIFKEPLYNDRPVIVNKLPKNCTVAPLAKRPRTAWIWRLGYAIINSSRPRKPVLMWHYKLCKYQAYYILITN